MADLFKPLLALAFAAFVVACVQEQPPAMAPEQPPPEAAAEPAAVDLPRWSPGAGEPPRYVGMWAVDQRICNNPAWRFEAERISTLGEVNCEFQRVGEIAGGYRVQASCTAEAPPAPFTLEIRFPGSARTMTLSGGPWDGPTTLVYCGPLPD